MKKMLIIVILSLGFSAVGSASSKICFWVWGNDGSKGDRVAIVATANALKFKPLTGQQYEGTFPREKGERQGHDGVTYLAYDAGNSDGSNTVYLDAKLLKDGTTGLMKVEWSGESFANQVYSCRDNR